eukprot:TRINITY_DN14932_c0_g2_i1.p1 TRINITY_DN14932_c0_g2~~TRINITY_DN14932_c0_g2_i1.p1  ORF type:complete len:159 (+),score=27.45 TRINITY_DN14932_c0_g2_i1:382-858(+)
MWQEWSFGWNEEGTGLFCCEPKCCEEHAHSMSLPMGRTLLQPPEVLALVGRLAREWQGSDYDLLHCNCCHFSDEFLRRLGLPGVPSWVTNLARAGAAIDDCIRRGSSRLETASAAVGLACNTARERAAAARLRLGRRCAAAGRGVGAVAGQHGLRQLA